MNTNRLTYKLTQIAIGANQSFLLHVPDVQLVQKEYENQKKENSEIVFPFWAKVWDASIVMANYLLKNPHLIHEKKVLELAAGLGLPSFVAAKFATSVICSDYINAPLGFVQYTIDYHNITNVFTQIVDCTNVPVNLTADVVLMSDISYDPQIHHRILKTILRFLSVNATIIITTPQRIASRDFAKNISPYIVESTVEKPISGNIPIEIWVLKNRN